MDPGTTARFTSFDNRSRTLFTPCVFCQGSPVWRLTVRINGPATGNAFPVRLAAHVVSDDDSYF